MSQYQFDFRNYARTPTQTSSSRQPKTQQEIDAEEEALLDLMLEDQGEEVGMFSVTKKKPTLKKQGTTTTTTKNSWCAKRFELLCNNNNGDTTSIIPCIPDSVLQQEINEEEEEEEEEMQGVEAEEGTCLSDVLTTPPPFLTPLVPTPSPTTPFNPTTTTTQTPPTTDNTKNTPILTLMEWQAKSQITSGQALFNITKQNVLRQWSKKRKNPWAHQISMMDMCKKKRKLNPNIRDDSAILEKDGVHLLLGDAYTDHTTTTTTTTTLPLGDSSQLETKRGEKEEEEEEAEAKTRMKVYKALARNPYALMNLGNLGTSEPIVEPTTPWEAIQLALVCSCGIQEEGYYCYWIAKRFNESIRKPKNKEIKTLCKEWYARITPQNEKKVLKKIKRLEDQLIPKYTVDEIETFRAQTLDPMRDREKMANYFKAIPEFIFDKCLFFRRPGEVDVSGKDIWKVDPVNFRILNDSAKTYQSLTKFKPEESPYTNKTAALNLGHRVMATTFFDTFTNNLLTLDNPITKTGKSLFVDGVADVTPTGMPGGVSGGGGGGGGGIQKKTIKTKSTVKISSSTSSIAAMLQKRAAAMNVFSPSSNNKKVFNSDPNLLSDTNTNTNATTTTTTTTKQIRKKQVGTEKPKPSGAQTLSGGNNNNTTTTRKQTDPKTTYLNQFDLS